MAHALPFEGDPEPFDVRDPVTGLPIRPRLDAALELQAADARRTGRSFSLVLADLDHLAAVNAERGRPVGDGVLRAVAERFRQQAGVSDVIVRWSGDRIAVLVPGADVVAAYRCAERLRTALAATPLDTPAAALPMTASFGVAEFLPDERADKTIARAEAAVRAAKEGGRDVVRIAAARPPAPATALRAAGG